MVTKARTSLCAHLGRRLFARRTGAGLSLRALAERSGLSERFLRELERGRANVSVERLEDLARALGTTAGRLLRDAEVELERPGPGGRVIALLGLRGAGKSAVGRRLAARLELPFFELDALVERAAGLSLGEVFALHGEAYYRRLELEALARFLDAQPQAVLATGGGIVANEEAFRLLQDRALTVWLRASPEDHWDRVVRQGDARPMAENPRARTELRRILAEREPLYRRARLSIDTSRLGLVRTVAALERRIGRETGVVERG